jgi:hypothetical protein
VLTRLGRVNRPRGPFHVHALNAERPGELLN